MKIELSERELQIILEALIKEPYIQVVDLINKIHNEIVKMNEAGKEVRQCKEQNLQG